MEQQIHRQLDGSVDGKKKVARPRIRFNNRVSKTRKECLKLSSVLNQKYPLIIREQLTYFQLYTD